MKTATIIGTGAVGALYGWRLLQALGKNRVQVLAEGERKERYERQGFLINGEQVFFPVVTPSEAKTTDLVVIATKNLNIEEAVAAIKTAVGKDTAILSLLNGIDSEHLLEQAYGPEHVLYSFAVGLSSRHSGNRIEFDQEGKIVFGERDNRKTDRVKAIGELFDRAHIAYTVPDDIQVELWKKFMLNTAFNTLSAVCLASYGDFKANSLEKLTWMASKEVQAVAKAEGILLSDEMIEHNYKTIIGLEPHGKTSMFQDMEAGRKTENQWFCEAVVTLGRKHSIPTPTCEVLSLLVQSCEYARFKRP
jgi:2-dehydropantoate 2-reductase